jgi:hypothetical protein
MSLRQSQQSEEYIKIEKISDAEEASEDENVSLKFGLIEKNNFTISNSHSKQKKKPNNQFKKKKAGGRVEIPPLSLNRLQVDYADFVTPDQPHEVEDSPSLYIRDLGASETSPQVLTSHEESYKETPASQYDETSYNEFEEPSSFSATNLPQLDPLSSERRHKYPQLNIATNGSESENSNFHTASKTMFKTVNDEISYLNSIKEDHKGSIPITYMNTKQIISSYETVEMNNTGSIEYSDTTHDFSHKFKKDSAEHEMYITEKELLFESKTPATSGKKEQPKSRASVKKRKTEKLSLRQPRVLNLMQADEAPTPPLETLDLIDFNTSEMKKMERAEFNDDLNMYGINLAERVKESDRLAPALDLKVKETSLKSSGNSSELVSNKSIYEESNDVLRSGAKGKNRSWRKRRRGQKICSQPY